MIKSHIPTINAPAKISVPEGLLIANESKTCIKHGRPIGSKDKNPRKPKGAKVNDDDIKDKIVFDKLPEKLGDMTNNINLEEIQVSENNYCEEILINYVMSKQTWNRNKTDINDGDFAFNVALDIMREK